MGDDKSKRGPADRLRVDVGQRHERRYWTARFACTITELCAAVARVGVMAAKVRRRLRYVKTGR